MAVIKCKMCGGDLNIEEGMSVAECEYCGTKQTVPNVDDEKKLKLFERANRLRAACEFDKAAGVYESILADFDTEAEAYWGLILCRYGIEYVDDPAAGRKIPTCHRSSFESVLDDPNFELVMENSDAVSRQVYRSEAKAIEELRKRIIEVSSKEEPYDVFISYKELDGDGERTVDSVIAQDIYKELTNEGYRVFFSRISLESKLGVEYEPYIFAALNSAKVMLVVGTSYDNFNAVWVKNEWSRYLALMSKERGRALIPCFKALTPTICRRSSISSPRRTWARLARCRTLSVAWRSSLARSSRSSRRLWRPRRSCAARATLRRPPLSSAATWRSRTASGKMPRPTSTRR